MRRRFVFSAITALAVLVAGCSGESTKDSSKASSTSTSVDTTDGKIVEVPSSLDHPIVMYMKEIDREKVTIDGLSGSVKLWYTQPAIAITALSCEGDVLLYEVTYVVTTLTTKPGNMHTSIGLRTPESSEYVWYSDTAELDASDEEVAIASTIIVAVPRDTDIHMRLVSVGGDSGDSPDHSSRHYDEYMPEDDMPIITASQCLMDA